MFEFLGIIGTKLYRKPEWVTHMEELNTALKGKYPQGGASHACSMDLSADSLESAANQKKNPQPPNTNQGIVSAESLRSALSSLLSEDDSPFYLRFPQGSRKNSEASIQSEPSPHKNRYKNDFIASTMTDYLNSHRHSVGSVMELLHTKPADSHYESFDVINSDYEELEQVGNDTLEEQEDEEQPAFFILSPIEEKSEPSTRSSSFRGSSGSEQRRYYSSSCNPLPKPYEDYHELERYHTIPRVKNENPKELGRGYFESTMYPLEPREIDPSAFFQLHTADSQEELQEFLLLESECMSDRGRGLAAAFSPEEDEEPGKL